MVACRTAGGREVTAPKKRQGTKRPKKKKNKKKKKTKQNKQITRGRKKYRYYLFLPLYLLLFSLFLTFILFLHRISTLGDTHYPLSTFRTCFLSSTKNRFDSIRFLRGRTHTTN
ncbi:hypothetical protein H112_02057 [Trichophyton rubrum D6]|nr:hypothetical protein H112_02057 [Trichophyton rubrum D6]